MLCSCCGQLSCTERSIGASGLVGKRVTQYCLDQGHYVVKIDLPGTNSQDQPNSGFHGINVAEDYDALFEAFQGCDAVIHFAAIPSPGGANSDARVYSTNSNASFNALHAAGKLGIKKICQASSVNALGLVYSERPMVFDSFPIEENDKPRISDAYALSKQVCETQADAMVYWFPGMTIASMRFHHVNPLSICRKRLADDVDLGARELWGWVSPDAVARACLMSIEGDHFKGHEAFNIVAPTTVYEDKASADLAKQYYPDTHLKDLSGNKSFWNCDKAKRILGWEHTETE